ncbi:hypothetical protein Tco_0171692 [Tanacetum coccineum]
MIEDHQVQRILVEDGSSSEIMYEYCFRNLSVNIRSRLRKCIAPLMGFSGEMYHPLGIIDLRVTIGKAGKNKTVLMEYCISKMSFVVQRHNRKDRNEKPHSARKGARFVEGGTVAST